MNETKTLLGQIWIQDDKLLQEQTLITTSGISDNVVVLIDDIWNDLLSNSGTYKSKGSYFYWEEKVTSIEDDDIEVDTKIECPKPRYEDIEKLKNNYDPETGSISGEYSGDYALYWAKKAYETELTYENEMAVQRKEVIFFILMPPKF